QLRERRAWALHASLDSSEFSGWQRHGNASTRPSSRAARCGGSTSSKSPAARAQEEVGSGGAGDMVDERPQTLLQVAFRSRRIKKSFAPGGSPKRREHIAEGRASLVGVPGQNLEPCSSTAVTLLDVPEHREAVADERHWGGALDG